MKKIAWKLEIWNQQFHAMPFARVLLCLNEIKNLKNQHLGTLKLLLNMELLFPKTYFFYLLIVGMPTYIYLFAPTIYLFCLLCLRKNLDRITENEKHIFFYFCLEHVYWTQHTTVWCLNFWFFLFVVCFSFYNHLNWITIVKARWVASLQCTVLPRNLEP